MLQDMVALMILSIVTIRRDDREAPQPLTVMASSPCQTCHDITYVAPRRTKYMGHFRPAELFKGSSKRYPHVYLASLYVLLVLLCSAARAETLVPRNIQYEFEVKEDAYAKSCNVLLLLLNIPSPEAVNFHFIVSQRKSDGLTFVGFSLDVGDLKFVNGLPAGTNKAVLSSAAFISPTFSSVGRLNGGPIADGGVLESTADPQVYTYYLTAFLGGDFQIQFERKGIPATRTYTVEEKPPTNVISQFSDCVSSLQH